MSCLVAVVAEDNFPRVLQDKFSVFVREGGSKRGDDIFNTRTEKRNGVHVAFDDDSHARRTYRTIRLVQPKKQTALVKNFGLRRVKVFGLSIVRAFQNPSAEANRMSENVTNRNHDAGAKSVVEAGRIFAPDDKSSLFDLLWGKSSAREIRQEFFPIIGRVAQFESFNRLLVYSPRQKIFPANFAAGSLD